MQRHFTATAFVIDSQNRVLLLWHKRLGRWMPPGGHVDENETPEETARRECLEETGLEVEILGEPCPELFSQNPDEGQMLKKPFALLLENIPASAERNEPAHQHMDFLYRASPVDETQDLTLAEDEGTKLRWFTEPEIAEMNAESEIFSNVQEYILSALRSRSTVS